MEHIHLSKSLNRDQWLAFDSFKQTITFQCDKAARLFLIFGHLQQWKITQTCFFAKVVSKLCLPLNKHWNVRQRFLHFGLSGKISPNLVQLAQITSSIQQKARLLTKTMICRTSSSTYPESTESSMHWSGAVKGSSSNPRGGTFGSGMTSRNGASWRATSMKEEDLHLFS